MKKVTLLLLFLPLLLIGDDLKSLLAYAQKHNHLIKSADYVIAAKRSDLKSVQKSYYPTVDVAAFYKRDDKATPFSPGISYGAEATLSFELYDGGRKSSLKKAKEEHLLSAEISKEEKKKQLFLSITKTFFTIKTLQASLKAQQESQKALLAQLKRTRAFYNANLTTSDVCDRLQAAYDQSSYAVEKLSFQIYSLKKSLQLQVGKEIQQIEDSHFKKSRIQEEETLDSIKILKHSRNALLKEGKSIESNYYPNIKLQDSYAFYAYEKAPYFAGKPIPLLDKQNLFMATLSVRLFDFGALQQKTEVLKLQAAALDEKIRYTSQKQHNEITLSRKRIHSANIQIKSAKSALKAAKSALATITKKYQAGIVDNVVYLDALASWREAKARYEKSQNDLEIAYAIYYYYNAKNLEEFLQ